MPQDAGIEAQTFHYEESAEKIAADKEMRQATDAVLIAADGKSNCVLMSIQEARKFVSSKKKFIL